MIPVVLCIKELTKESITPFDLIGEKTILEFMINRLENREIILIYSNFNYGNKIKSIAEKYNNVEPIYVNEEGQLSFIRKYMIKKKITDIAIYDHTYVLLDIRVLDVLEKIHIKKNCEYSYCDHYYGSVIGTGCNIINISCVNKLQDMNVSQYCLHNIKYLIRQSGRKIKIYKYNYINQRSSYSLICESIDDIDKINFILSNIKTEENKDIYSYIEKFEEQLFPNNSLRVQEVGINKIFLHSSKLRVLLSENIFDNTYPITVELTLTNSCNLNCIFCSDKKLRTREGINETLSIETLGKLFKELSCGGTKGIVLEGGGEPTLHPCFENIVYEAKNNGLAVGLITNGTSILSDSVLKQFEWVRVSLDASNREEYCKLKGKDLFTYVLQNIRQYRKNTKVLGIGYVATKDNLNDIESFIMHMRSLNVNYVQIRPVVDCPELYPEKVDLTYLKIFETNRFEVIVDGMKENSLKGNFSLPCRANSLTSIITGEGNVYICGRLNIYKWIHPIGNIKTSSFHSIWNGDERRKQLNLLNNNKFCENICPQCRISKFNALVASVKKINSINFI